MSTKERPRRHAQRQKSLELNEEKRRLGYRINDFCALTGISRVTAWRLVKAGTLKVVYLGRIPIVPASEVSRLGLSPEAA
jgi:predicted DNA-binding transcriptional regulator AlpA